ncbi:MAG: response regulator transcription factor, partial [Verrucomicrobiota bacterium]
MKRVYIIDDHPIMRMGLGSLIRGEDDLDLAGEAGSAAEGIRMVEESGPADVALIDLSLPDRSGMELLKDFQVMAPEMLCLVISSHDEEVYAERVLRAGGKGYLMKNRAPELLITGVRQVLAGQIYVSQEMTAKMMQVFATGVSGAKGQIATLTDR